MQNTITTVDTVIDKQDLMDTKDVETPLSATASSHRFPQRKNKQKEAQIPAIKPSMCWISTLVGRQQKKNDCLSPRCYGN